jgi:hypothetical protein
MPERSGGGAARPKAAVWWSRSARPPQGTASPGREGPRASSFVMISPPHCSPGSRSAGLGRIGPRQGRDGPQWESKKKPS